MAGDAEKLDAWSDAATILQTRARAKIEIDPHSCWSNSRGSVSSYALLRRRVEVSSLLRYSVRAVRLEDNPRTGAEISHHEPREKCEQGYTEQCREARDGATEGQTVSYIHSLCKENKSIDKYVPPI